MYKRICSNPDNNHNCKHILEYKHESSYKIAIKKNSLCRSCSMFRKYVGENNPMYGRTGKICQH